MLISRCAPDKVRYQSLKFVCKCYITPFCSCLRGVITFRIWNTLSAITFETLMQSTSLYTFFLRKWVKESIFGIKFYKKTPNFLEKMAKKLFWPKFQNSDNFVQFWYPSPAIARCVVRLKCRHGVPFVVACHISPIPNHLSDNISPIFCVCIYLHLLFYITLIYCKTLKFRGMFFSRINNRWQFRCNLISRIWNLVHCKHCKNIILRAI